MAQSVHVRTLPKEFSCHCNPNGSWCIGWAPPPTTKARMEAKTYNAHKPAKFAVRFYVVTGSVKPYISSFFDNRAGNKTGVCGAVDYTGFSVS